MNNTIEELLKSIRNQLPNSSEQTIEIEKAITSQKYRQAFLLINNLKEKNFGGNLPINLYST